MALCASAAHASKGVHGSWKSTSFHEPRTGPSLSLEPSEATWLSCHITGVAHCSSEPCSEPCAGRYRVRALPRPLARLHGVCMGRRGASIYTVSALFGHFCYVGGFGDLGDPVVPTLRGVSGDVVTVYAY